MKFKVIFSAFFFLVALVISENICLALSISLYITFRVFSSSLEVGNTESFKSNLDASRCNLSESEAFILSGEASFSISETSNGYFRISSEVFLKN